MRFYTQQHESYCGVDLHALSLYLCILDQEGGVRLHRNIPANPEAFLRAIEPYRDGLVVACECMFAWYWLADLCAEQEIPFVLGHALYMKAIHGAKSKNDRIDSRKIAALLRGGLIPQAYVYPREWRATRDLLRRRTRFVRQRALLFSHIHTSNAQYNLQPLPKRITYPKNREGLPDHFTLDESLHKSVEADCLLAAAYDDVVRELELFLNRRCKIHDSENYYRLRSVPGIGKILTLTLLYEIHHIDRFPRVQDFSSYARLVKCPHKSAGKLKGYGGKKMGNVHLKWAFSEAAVLFLQRCPRAKKIHQRWESKHGSAKALSITAHKLGRAVYYMMKRKKPFDVERFVA